MIEIAPSFGRNFIVFNSETKQICRLLSALLLQAHQNELKQVGGSTLKLFIFLPHLIIFRINWCYL